MYQAHTSSASTVTAVEQRKAVFPAILALMFGAFLLFGTGFAGSATIHNAAHDARHAFAFPCH